MKKNFPQGKNLKLAAFFILGVLFIISISLIWKFIILIHQSRFDSQHQFILEIDDKIINVVCFTPEGHTVSVITIKGLNEDRSISKEISLPIDGIIKIEKDGGTLSQVITSSIFNFRNYGDINIIDKIKMWWFLQSISPNNISEKDIKIPVTDDVFLNVIPKLFMDKSLYQEAKTIEVINATGVSGFAGRLARLISNIGGNIIMIETASEIQDKSSLDYFGEYSYTEKRIGQILNMEPSFIRKKPAIADIIITIGKESIDTNNF